MLRLLLFQQCTLFTVLIYYYAYNVVYSTYFYWIYFVLTCVVPEYIHTTTKRGRRRWEGRGVGGVGCGGSVSIISLPNPLNCPQTAL